MFLGVVEFEYLWPNKEENETWGKKQQTVIHIVYCYVVLSTVFLLFDDDDNDDEGDEHLSQLQCQLLLTNEMTHEKALVVKKANYTVKIIDGNHMHR